MSAVDVAPPPLHTVLMGWQDAVVALVVLGAVLYLSSRFWTPRRRAPTGKPDVAASSLVRRRPPR